MEYYLTSSLVKMNCLIIVENVKESVKQFDLSNGLIANFVRKNANRIYFVNVFFSTQFSQLHFSEEFDKIFERLSATFNDNVENYPAK